MIGAVVWFTVGIGLLLAGVVFVRIVLAERREKARPPDAESCPSTPYRSPSETAKDLGTDTTWVSIWAERVSGIYGQIMDTPFNEVEIRFKAKTGDLKKNKSDRCYGWLVTVGHDSSSWSTDLRSAMRELEVRLDSKTKARLLEFETKAKSLRDAGELASKLRDIGGYK